MANIINVSLENGLITLAVDNAKNTVAVTNGDASRDALFVVFNASVLNGQPVGSVIVWSYTQPANSSGTIAIPTKDNNGTAISWQVGTISVKGGGTVQTIVSPPWELTMA